MNTDLTNLLAIIGFLAICYWVGTSWEGRNKR